MPRPIVHESTERLYEALGPMTDGDEQRDWPLLNICEALCLAFAAQIWDYVVDEPDGVGGVDRLGWEVALSPADIPADGLPWLSQFVGAELTPVMTEADQRAAVANPSGFRRGSPAAMVEAVQRTLTGSRTVNIDERVGDDAYQLAVTTLPEETPSPALTTLAILSQKPIGIVVDIDTPAAWSWADLIAEHADWAEVDATYPDWIDAMTVPA